MKAITHLTFYTVITSKLLKLNYKNYERQYDPMKLQIELEKSQLNHLSSLLFCVIINFYRMKEMKTLEIKNFFSILAEFSVLTF